MLKRLAIAIGAIMALTTPMAAQAKEKVYAPKSKWVVDYGVDRCTVGREFAYENQSVMLTFTRVGSSDGVRIALIGDLPRIKVANSITMRFFPFGDSFESDFFNGVSDDRKSVAIILSTLAPFKFNEENADKFVSRGVNYRLKEEHLKAINGLVIDPNPGSAMHFQTGPMGPLFNELEKCTNSLAKYWGFDNEVLNSLSKNAEPIGSPAKWMRSTDYPSGFAMMGRMGVVDFRLTVDETGAVTQCDISNAMGGERFSENVCKGVMSRARFTPALDKDGKPTKDLYINRVIFMMENG